MAAYSWRQAAYGGGGQAAGAQTEAGHGAAAEQLLPRAGDAMVVLNKYAARCALAYSKTAAPSATGTGFTGKVVVQSSPPITSLGWAPQKKLATNAAAENLTTVLIQNHIMTTDGHIIHPLNAATIQRVNDILQHTNTQGPPAGGAPFLAHAQPAWPGPAAVTHPPTSATAVTAAPPVAAASSPYPSHATPPTVFVSRPAPFVPGPAHAAAASAVSAAAAALVGNGSPSLVNHLRAAPPEQLRDFLLQSTSGDPLPSHFHHCRLTWSSLPPDPTAWMRLQQLLSNGNRPPPTKLYRSHVHSAAHMPLHFAVVEIVATEPLFVVGAHMRKADAARIAAALALQVATESTPTRRQIEQQALFHLPPVNLHIDQRRASYLGQQLRRIRELNEFWEPDPLPQHQPSWVGEDEEEEAQASRAAPASAAGQDVIDDLPQIDLEGSMDDGSEQPKSKKPSPSHPDIATALASEESGARRLQLQAFERMKQRRLADPGGSLREKLPAVEKSVAIMSAIIHNQVVVIAGETGSGKTTQVPQMILDHALDSNLMSPCRIVCTQPRRISAISVARHVAKDRHETVGESVGFAVRVSAQPPRWPAHILYCTTGHLLKSLEDDASLQKITHIIVDEVHERDMHTDFLLAVLRSIIKRRKDLKVIIMSATIELERFSAYFNNAPKVLVSGRLFDVQDYFLDDFGPYLPPQHAKALNSENLASFDTHLWVDVLRLLCQYHPEGAVLVFLPGWQEIRSLQKALLADSQFREGKYLILPLHSKLDDDSQSLVFLQPPAGTRKIVLSTNIAETSITIEDIALVVDSGLVKNKDFDSISGISTLLSSWASKANVQQRKGRAGRVMGGTCYHVYTREQYSKMADYPTPEILRSPLWNIILWIRSYNLADDIHEFLRSCMDQPPTADISRAIDELIDIGGLNADSTLTTLGRYLARIPLDPRHGKLLIMAHLFGCGDMALTALSTVELKVQRGTLDMKGEATTEQVKDRKREWAGSWQYDGMPLLAVLRNFMNCEKHRRSDFCRSYMLGYETLNHMIKLRSDLANYIDDFRLVPWFAPQSFEEEMMLFVMLLVEAYYPNIGRIPPPSLMHEKKKFSRISTIRHGALIIAPSGINSNIKDLRGDFLVYGGVLDTGVKGLIDTAVVPAVAVLCFGGQQLNVVGAPNPDFEDIQIDRSRLLTVRAAPEICRLMRDIRDLVQREVTMSLEAVRHGKPPDFRSAEHMRCLRSLVDSLIAVGAEEMEIPLPHHQ